MTHKIFVTVWAASVIALLAVLTTGLACSSSQEQHPSDQLTESERTRAKNLASQFFESNKLLSDTPIYFIGADLYRDKKAEEKGEAERRARVTYYRYFKDMTFISTVNLTQGEVTDIDSVAHLPTALSEEEFKIARDLALSNDEIKEALGDYLDKAEVEALVFRTSSREDALFGHRVVRLLFKIGRDYLSEPVVNVDLTERKIMIESAKKEP